MIKLGQQRDRDPLKSRKDSLQARVVKQLPGLLRNNR